MYGNERNTRFLVKLFINYLNGKLIANLQYDFAVNGTRKIAVYPLFDVLFLFFFQEQQEDEMLKQNLKCSICLCELKEEELLESQLPDKDLGKEEIPQDDDKEEDENDNNAEDKGKGKGDGDEKEDEAETARKQKNAKRKHRFRFGGKANQLVTDDTVVGLCKCTYGHYFHAKCILEALNNKIECPNCKQAYGPITGDQPDGRLYVTCQRAQCAGFDEKDAVKMLFEFPGGIQGANHPHPGKNYFGDLREAFFPNNKEGREWAMLVRLAFERKLMFGIGRSQTLKLDDRIIFGSIHLKTATTGGTEKHGYPDPNYFKNLEKELAVKNITRKQLEELDPVHKKFIEDGFPPE